MTEKPKTTLQLAISNLELKNPKTGEKIRRDVIKLLLIFIGFNYHFFFHIPNRLA